MCLDFRINFDFDVKTDLSAVINFNIFNSTAERTIGRPLIFLSYALPRSVTAQT